MSQVSTAPIEDANSMIPEVHSSVRNSDEFQPTRLNGCSLWLDGADPLATGAPSTMALGTEVPIWYDKSSSQNHFTTTHGSPSIFTKLITVKHRTVMTSTVPITLGANASIFIVYKCTIPRIVNLFGFASAFDFNIRVNYLKNTLTCANQNDFFFQNQGANTLFHVNGVAASGTTPTESDSVANNYFAGLNLVNGQINMSQSGGGPFNPTLFSISNKTEWTPSRFFEGRIAEIIMFNDSISEVERQQVEGYLAKKWSLNLPGSHEYYGETNHTMGSFGLSGVAPLVKKSASSAKFTPDSLPDCCLWLDAADPNGNSDPFTGSNLSVWRDKSGNGYDATMNTGATVAYSSNALNGKPSLQFVPTTTMAARVPTNTFSSAFTLFVVFQKTGINGFSDTLVTRTQGDMPALFDMYTTNGVTSRFLGSGKTDTCASYTTQDEVFRSTTPMIYSAAADVLSATWHEFQNGRQTQNLVASGTSMCGDAATHVYIGTRDGNDTSMTGNISEIIMYNAPLSGPDRQKIEGYLARKWGLRSSLPADHPYLMIPPLP